MKIGAIPGANAMAGIGSLELWCGSFCNRVEQNRRGTATVDTVALRDDGENNRAT